jgi:hypothetical protein
MIDRVTFTGADDNTDVSAMLEISQIWPWVEWGILFSKSHAGTPRYPSLGWLAHLAETFGPAGTPGASPLSAHLCGRIMRDTLHGRETWRGMYGHVCDIFQRVQLNFHAEPQPNGRLDQMFEANPDYQWIYQVDGVNDDLVRNVVRWHGGSPLFDRSGGAGVKPETWPEPWADVYCGYAGGLGPDNIDHEMPLIRGFSGIGRAWVDMESRVRSDDGQRFDLDKVLLVIKACENWVAMPRKAVQS